MRVAMLLVDKLGRRTRELRPFYVSERYAKLFELIKKGRRATAEEIATYEQNRSAKVKKDVSSTIEPKVKIEGSEDITSKFVTKEGDLVDVRVDSEQEQISSEPLAVPAMSRGRGRPRKPKVESEE